MNLDYSLEHQKWEAPQKMAVIGAKYDHFCVGVLDHVLDMWSAKFDYDKVWMLHIECIVWYLFWLFTLANMAGSAGQFSHTSGKRGYWSYSGWKIFLMATVWKEWQYL